MSTSDYAAPGVLYVRADDDAKSSRYELCSDDLFSLLVTVV
jgi:hypothetical protein